MVISTQVLTYLSDIISYSLSLTVPPSWYLPPSIGLSTLENNVLQSVIRWARPYPDPQTSPPSYLSSPIFLSPRFNAFREIIRVSGKSPRLWASSQYQYGAQTLSATVVILSNAASQAKSLHEAIAADPLE